MEYQSGDVDEMMKIHARKVKAFLLVHQLKLAELALQEYHMTVRELYTSLTEFSFDYKREGWDKIDENLIKLIAEIEEKFQ
jgi:hypothetical protein